MKENFTAPEMEIIDMEKDFVLANGSGECASGDPTEIDWEPEF